MKQLTCILIIITLVSISFYGARHGDTTITIAATFGMLLFVAYNYFMSKEFGRLAKTLDELREKFEFLKQDAITNREKLEAKAREIEARVKKITATK